MTGPPEVGPSDAVLPAPVTRDPWTNLADLTPARLALGRAGPGLPTREVLKLGLAHAQARDAVHTAMDHDMIVAGTAALGLQTLAVESAASGRDIYLRRPDLGRRLSDESRVLLQEQPRREADVAIVIGDGLSAAAMNLNALPLVAALLPRLSAASLRVAPLVVARQARVALGDEIGALLGARLVIVLIGERPGLSAADSLGAYLTFGPRVGRTDAERNCVSNIRAAGLPPAAAAAKIKWLAQQALILSLTGVSLKDDSDLLVSSARPEGAIAP